MDPRSSIRNNIAERYGQLFSKDDVNRGRQLEMDIARGLAVLFMVMIHVQIVFSTEVLDESSIGSFINFLGTPPAAPVFMFLLGTFIIYSSRSAPATLFKRGLLLILGGYLLNLCRGTLPAMAQWSYLGGDQYLTIASKVLIEIDILQFAGLAFIFFAIVRKYQVKNHMMVLFAVACGVASLFLVSVQTEEYFTMAITGLFWGSSIVSYFPFVSWILMPVAGYVFGHYLIRVNDKEKFYKMTILASGAALAFSIVVLIIGLGVDIGITDDYVYYHQDLLANVFYISFAIFWISVLYYVTKMIPRLIGMTIGRWSRNVTVIYIIHWILIGWIAIFIGRHELDLPSYILLVALIFGASDVIALLYQKRKRKGKESTVLA